MNPIRGIERSIPKLGGLEKGHHRTQ